jgi:hypothetical protein
MLNDWAVTRQDVDVAIKIWGPSKALLKGKTVRCKPPMVQQDIIEVPREIWQLHKKVTLVIDFFFVNNIPFFVTYSLHICFPLVTHMQNQKAITIFKALKSIHTYYLQRGFQIVFIEGDGEFKPLEDGMSELYGGPALNLISANKHVPKVERKIRVIKERSRAVIYSKPFNLIPLLMQIHLVLFVTKQLNLVPVKGSVLAMYNPQKI